MATLTDEESGRLYSWWWDSHISPKNSKWLQENLTDMDAKVKAMIKLIEEDADSFARRAEMYYKKRPELMKLVEEFYRAYRALAERYDHATGALRQAQRTMAEAFPNQIPFSPADDSLLNYFPVEVEPHTPELSHPIRPLYDPDDLQKDDSGVSLHSHPIMENGEYSDENISLTSKKGLKNLNEMFGSGFDMDHGRVAEVKARKGFKFPEDKKKTFESVKQSTFGDVQDQKLEERNGMGSKMRGLHDKNSQLSSDNQNLKMKILSESDRADDAQNEIEILRKALSKLESEKEAAILQQRQCLESVSNLEAEVSRRKSDVVRLNGEILEGVTRLKAAEEHLLLLKKTNQSLQSEIDTLGQKVTVQQQELMNNNEELKKLNICIQDERIHLNRTEAALHSLQSLHSKSQEEQKKLTMELQKRTQILNDMEFRKHDLEEEIRRYKEESHTLNEQNQSFAMSMKNLQMEIFSLKEEKGKLEEEVRLRVKERNAFQLELFHRREELNDLDRRHQDVIEQVLSVGLDASCLHSSIKELQDENLKLKEICKGNDHDKVILSAKLENMENILEKNVLLENSLSDASSEMEDLRERLKTLQESFQCLQGEKLNLEAEKFFLVSQVESIAQNFEKLSEKNTILEKSLSDVNGEHKILRQKTKNLEKSCEVLQDEKLALLVERNGLMSQLETVKQCLENLGKRHADLEHKHLCLEKERESALQCVNQLRISLNLELQERANYFQSSQTQLASMENHLHILQQESQLRKQQLEEEHVKIMNSEIETFLLLRYVHDMRESNLSLSVECQEHVQASLQAKKLISKLEQDVIERESRLAVLQENNDDLRTGIFCVLKALNIDEDHGFLYRSERELFPLILGKIQGINDSLLNAHDEMQNLLYEKIVINTLLEQLRLDASDLKQEKYVLEQDSEVRIKEVFLLQNENYELLKLNDQLRNDTNNSSYQVEILAAEAGMLREKLSDSLEAYQTLKNENSKVQESNQSFKVKIYDLYFENCIMEEENCSLLGETTNLGNLSLIFKNICCEKYSELKTLMDELDHLRGLCNELVEVRVKAARVEEENFSLKESIAAFEKFKNRSVFLEVELNDIRILSEQLNNEVEIGKNRLSQKEIELSEMHQMLEAEEFEREKLQKKLWELELKDELLSSALEKVSFRSWILADELSRVRTVNQLLNGEIEIGNNLLNQKEMELSQTVQKLEAEEFEREQLHQQIWELEFKNEHLNSVVVKFINHFPILENELSEFRILNENLYSEIKFRKNQLSQKEMKLSEAEQKLQSQEFEMEELSKQLWFLEFKDENLNSSMEKFRSHVLVLDEELKEVRSINEHMENEVQIGKNLLNQKEKELEQAYQKIKAVDFESEELCRKVSELELKNGHLSSLLQEKIDEVELLEEETAALYELLQIGAVSLALYEEKACDLISSCECLKENFMTQERKFDEERAKTIRDNKKLEETIFDLEEENASLKAELEAYFPLISSLKESMSSLEEHTKSLRNPHVTFSKKNQPQLQVTALVDMHGLSGHVLNESSEITALTGISELQKLQAQIQTVEKDLKDLGRLAKQSSTSEDYRSISVIEGTEELKSNSRYAEHVETAKDDCRQVCVGKIGEKVEPQNGKADASEAKHELMMKDIQLDHASDPFTSYENGMDSNEIALRGESVADDQMLELWETAERNFRVGSSAAKKSTSSACDDEIVFHEIDAVEGQKSEFPSSELQVDKELAVDKLEVPKKASDLGQRGNKKILERLASDAQRLSNLQASAQELRRKFEISEKANLLLGFEYDNVKAQLKDVIEAISKLVDMNEELMKNIEHKYPSGKARKLEEKGDVQRWNVSKRARKWSEKVGRLELEVQRIQFVMLKLESEYEGRRSNALNKRKIPLKDFLNGVRESRRQTLSLCACAKSSSVSD